MQQRYDASAALTIQIILGEHILADFCKKSLCFLLQLSLPEVSSGIICMS
jgi:hypothetical protein